VIVGGVIAALAGYWAEWSKRKWQSEDLHKAASRERQEEHDRWTRQARLEIYGRFLGKDRQATDASAKVRNLRGPDLEHERGRALDILGAAVGPFEVAYGQTTLVGSEPLIEAANTLRERVFDEVQRAVRGEQAAEDSLRGARLMFLTVARVELGLPFRLKDEHQVLKPDPTSRGTTIH
jgi:hypothetical protein